MFQSALFLSSSGLKGKYPSSRGRVPYLPVGVELESLSDGCGVGGVEGFAPIDGEVKGHGFSWPWNAVDCSFFDVASSKLPCRNPGGPHDVSVDLIEFGPLEVGAVDIEGILLPPEVEGEEFSRGSLVLGIGLVGRDITGDVGADSNLLGDVSVDEGVGVGCLRGVVV